MAKKLGARVKFLFSGQVRNTFFRAFVGIFGTVWLFVEALSFFFGDYLIPLKSNIFIFIILFSATISLYISFPKLSYTRKYRKSNVEISVKVGDLLDDVREGTGHIAIGINNRLSPRSIRQPTGKSLRFQIATAFFGGRSDLLDKGVLHSLSRQNIVAKIGSEYKVSLGSVSVVEINKSKIFFLINQEYDHEKKEVCDTAKEDIWLGFCNLWAAVKSRGGNSPIAVPVLGSKVGRAPASRISLIQLILISFAIANRSVPITERLTIFIRDHDYSPSEMFEIFRFMDELDL